MRYTTEAQKAIEAALLERLGFTLIHSGKTEFGLEYSRYENENRYTVNLIEEWR